jgi:ATP-dependent RNA helicase MRH4
MDRSSKRTREGSHTLVMSRRRTRRASLRRTEGKRETKTRSDGVRVPRCGHPTSHISESAEFNFSVTPEAPHTLPSAFSSPPLSSSLHQSVHDVPGPNARPAPIQPLSLKHLFVTTPLDSYRRFLLSSETGSGKSLAYLLPILNVLKTAEHLHDALVRVHSYWHQPTNFPVSWQVLGRCLSLQTPRAEHITREHCARSGVSHEDGSCFPRR